jgi:hypothetical protein
MRILAESHCERDAPPTAAHAASWSEGPTDFYNKQVVFKSKSAVLQVAGGAAPNIADRCPPSANIPGDVMRLRYAFRSSSLIQEGNDQGGIRTLSFAHRLALERSPCGRRMRSVMTEQLKVQVKLLRVLSGWWPDIRTSFNCTSGGRSWFSSGRVANETLCRHFALPPSC